MTQALQVLQIVSEMTGRSVADVNPADTFAGLGIDSLNLMDLVMRIEDRCAIELTDQDLLPRNIATVAAMIATVERRQGGQL